MKMTLVTLKKPKKRIRKQSKNPRPALKRKVDAIHSKLIRAMYGERCVVTGSTDKVGCGHIFSRNHENTRWDIGPAGNCHPQAWASNYNHEINPWPFFNWYIEKHGKEALDELERRWHQDTPYRGIIRLRELKEQLEAKLEQVQSGVEPVEEYEELLT